MVGADVVDIEPKRGRELQHRLQVAARLDQPGPIPALDQGALGRGEAMAFDIGGLVGQEGRAVGR